MPKTTIQFTVVTRKIMDNCALFRVRNNAIRENEISWSSNNESTFEDHHQSLILIAPVNEIVNFPVPKTDTPVRFDISVSQINLTAYDTRPEPPPHNVPVTLMHGTMYYDSTVNQFYLLPEAIHPTYLSNPFYEYSFRSPDTAISNTTYMLRVMHQPSGAGVDFAHPIHNVNNLTLQAYVDTNLFNVETPLVTYKINMWY